MCGMEFGIESRDGYGCTTTDRNLVNDVARSRREENDVARTPIAAAGTGRITQTSHHACADVQDSEFAVGEEANTGAVGRPEGIHGTVSASDDSFDARAQGTEP